MLLPFPSNLLCPYISTLSLTFLGITYLTNAICFYIDWKAPFLLDPKPVERISLLSNFYNFLVSPLVILAYSLVELYALHELLLLGKTFCKHGASEQQALGTNVV